MFVIALDIGMCARRVNWRVNRAAFTQKLDPAGLKFFQQVAVSLFVLFGRLLLVKTNERDVWYRKNHSRNKLYTFWMRKKDDLIFFSFWWGVRDFLYIWETRRTNK